MEIDTLDTTAGNNNQPPPDGAPENTMAYSDVNDVMREGMAAAARWYADINGSLETTGVGGTLAVTTNRADLTLSDTLFLCFTIGDSATTSLVSTTLTVTPNGGSALANKELVTTTNGLVLRRYLVEGTKLLVAYNSTLDAFVVLSDIAGMHVRNFGGFPHDTEVGTISGTNFLLNRTSVTNRPQCYFDNVDSDEIVTLGYGMHHVELGSSNSITLDRRHSGIIIRIVPDDLDPTTINLSADFTAVPGGFFILDIDTLTDFVINIVPLGGGSTLSVTTGTAQGISRCMINYGSGSSAELHWLWISHETA